MNKTSIMVSLGCLRLSAVPGTGQERVCQVFCWQRVARVQAS